MNETSRLNYLRALGVESWMPRLQPLATELESEADPPPTTALPLVAEEQVITSGAEVMPQLAQTSAPFVQQLQSPLAQSVLAQASVQWSVPAQDGSTLAVLGVDAREQTLKPSSFDFEWDIVTKMLAAIGHRAELCAVGGLTWQSNSAPIGLPYALLLIECAECDDALFDHWQHKTLDLLGATAVIAPHPRMFGIEAGLKRQAWINLQFLQQQWS